MSLTFEPPSTTTNGPLGRLAQAEEHVDLLRQQPAGGRRQGPGRADDRRVGAVGGAEGVVDVGVVALDELGHEGGIVALLARIEAEVLEELDAGRQLLQAGPHRRHRVARVGLALRPTEVAARRHRGAGLLQPGDGGQGGADAEVVDHLATGEGHVEIGPQQHPLAVERRQILQQRNSSHVRARGRR